MKKNRDIVYTEARIIIDKSKTIIVNINYAPTSNCQIRSINNMNEIIDNLEISELSNFINNRPKFALLLVSISNKSRLNKFVKAIENSKCKIHTTNSYEKIKNKFKYNCLICQ